MKTKTSRPYIYAAILILILFSTVFVVWKESNKGILEIKTTETTLDFFIDKEEKTPKSFKGGTAIFSVKQGIHSVIINKDGSWPWAKAFKLEQKGKVELTPFFVAKDTSGFMIGKNDPDYWKIFSLFYNNLINSSVKEELMFDETSKAKIRSADFYKNRTDVAIIAMENSIYAIEIDNPENINIQPIYKGNSPAFVKKDNETLYVKDGEILMIVNY